MTSRPGDPFALIKLMGTSRSIVKRGGGYALVDGGPGIVCKVKERVIREAFEFGFLIFAMAAPGKKWKSRLVASSTAIAEIYNASPLPSPGELLRNSFLGTKTKQCMRKRQFQSADDARKALVRMQIQGLTIGDLVIYRCPWCKHFHLGHDRKADAHA